MKTNGRETIYANYTEKQFLSGTIKDQEAKVIDVLSNSLGIHDANSKDTLYLIAYMYGDQDIKEKVKLTRTDINNKSVENWAYAFIDWKKTFLLGKPIQYAPIDDISKNEITVLNKFNKYENKHWLDLDLYEDVLCCGRGFRYSNTTKMSEEDEAPYELVNLDPWDTEVIYSSGINKEQIGAYVKTKMQHITQKIDPETNLVEDIINYYDEFNFYSRNRAFLLNNKSGNLQVISSNPLILGEHIITEYYSNKKRFSLIELGKDIFNDINYIENLDMDDIEGFVNSIMVFTNASVDSEGMNSIKEYGAVSIKSTEQKKASVEVLQSRLKSLDTQIFYLRKISALHNILSVPQAQNSGEVSNAETGKATLTGQGFTSASIRVEGEEQAFEKCDRNSLRTILKICKRYPNTGISKLKVSDIECKFSRDMSENILVKTQALMNLMSANIPPSIRNSVIGLFSDPVAVTKLQEAYEEEKRKIEQQLEATKKTTTSSANKVGEQNNKIQDTTQKQNQGQ